jgi:hypothetical protein
LPFPKAAMKKKYIHIGENTDKSVPREEDEMGEVV